MSEENRAERIIKFLTWPFVAVSLVAGVISYMYAGHSFSDALYGAVNLFGFQMIYDDMNMGIAVIRWVAPISVATTLFTEITPLFSWLRDRVLILTGKTIIYSDCRTGKALYENMKKKPVLRDPQKGAFFGESFADRIVIMTEQDEDGLEIYNRLIEQYNNKKLYFCLNKMEPNLLPSSGKVKIFNITDLVAGAFWNNTLNLAKELTPHNLYGGNSDISITIAIVGYGTLGRRILYKGLLLNIFSNNQKVVYNVYDDHIVSDTHKKEIERCTQWIDEVNFHCMGRECIDELEKADYIILTGEPKPEMIQEILYSTKKPDIYYYDPEGIGFEKAFFMDHIRGEKTIYDRLHSFGVLKEVIKEEKIFNNKFEWNAAKLNQLYEDNKEGYDRQNEKEMWDSWYRLDGFIKGSNINAVDYSETGNKIKKWPCYKNGKVEDMMAELIHIHWSRYYFLNHFKCGKKDKINMTHPKLVRYSELNKEEKDKDKRVFHFWDVIEKKL